MECNVRVVQKTHYNIFLINNNCWIETISFKGQVKRRVQLTEAALVRRSLAAGSFKGTHVGRFFAATPTEGFALEQVFYLQRSLHNSHGA